VTLVELVLVVFLLGLLVASSEPFVAATVGRTGLEAAARRVRADVVYARELAVLTGTNHGANFVTNQPYIVYRQTTANPVVDPLTQQPFSQDPLTMGNVAVTGNYQVEFDSRGSPVIGGGGSVNLSGGGGGRSVVVRANTGLVEIQ